MKLKSVPEATLGQLLVVLNRHHEALVKVEKENVVVVDIDRNVIAKIPAEFDTKGR